MTINSPYKSLSIWHSFAKRKNPWDMPHNFCPKLYANVYISWKLFCVREIISNKVENGRFGLCPEFTAVEQYFRNCENAMENFNLSPFRLTLILARWLWIKGVTFKMKKSPRNMVSYLKEVWHRCSAHIFPRMSSQCYITTKIFIMFNSIYSVTIFPLGPYL